MWVLILCPELKTTKTFKNLNKPKKKPTNLTKIVKSRVLLALLLVCVRDCPSWREDAVMPRHTCGPIRKLRTIVCK